MVHVSMWIIKIWCMLGVGLLEITTESFLPVKSFYISAWFCGIGTRVGLGGLGVWTKVLITQWGVFWWSSVFFMVLLGNFCSLFLRHLVWTSLVQVSLLSTFVKFWILNSRTNLHNNICSYKLPFWKMAKITFPRSKWTKLPNDFKLMFLKSVNRFRNSKTLVTKFSFWPW